MSVPFTPDQKELADTIRKFFAEKLTSEYLRKRTNQGSDSKLIAELQEMGLLTSFAPESKGGAGFGFRELGLLGLEAGRALMPEPVVEWAFANYVIGKHGDGKEAVLAGVFSGEERVAFLPRALISSKKITSTVSCEAKFLFGAGCSTAVLFEDDERLLLVPLKDSLRGSISLVDSTVNSSSCDIQGATALKLTDKSSVQVPYGILKALEIVGATEKAVEMTVEHVKTRKQFEAPIGSFQAVQQKLADAFVNLSAMKSLANFAAWSVEFSPEQLSLAGQAAANFASDKAPKIIEACIQLHGGTGFTWEYDLHLYLRRVKLLSTLLAESFRPEDILSAV